MEAASVSPILLSIFLLMEDITTLITSSPGGIPLSGRAAIIGCVDILLATPSDGMIFVEVAKQNPSLRTDVGVLCAAIEYSRFCDGYTKTSTVIDPCFQTFGQECNRR